MGGKNGRKRRRSKKAKGKELEQVNGELLPERSAMSIPLPLQSFQVSDVPGLEHPTSPPVSPDDTTPA